MTKKIGFIGCGNMGKAMIAGIIESKIAKPEDVMVSDVAPQALEQIHKEYKVCVTQDNKSVVEASDYIFLAVKPQYYEEVISGIRERVTQDQVLVSIAPGKTLEWLEEKMEKPCKIIRTMPNTPAMVKEGMMGICANTRVTNEELQTLREICEGFSKTEVVAEHLMDVVTAVSGSSPAYVFMFIEAMADAAVEGGMPRKQAYTFAAQAVLGSAKMVLETGIHPAELKDMVCSPAGTTIAAVRVLEEKGMRAAVMDAVVKCIEKSMEL